MCEPAVVSTPSVQNRSLMASGMPSSRPPSALARRASEALAISKARSGVSVMKALRPRAASTARTCASVSSFDENCFLARLSSAPAMVRSVRAAILLDHLRHHEEAVGGLRAVGEDLVAAVAVGDLVLAARQGHADGARHRLHLAGVDLLQLLDPMQDAVELLGHGVELALRHLDAGERGNMGDRGAIQRHVRTCRFRLKNARGT